MYSGKRAGGYAIGIIVGIVTLALLLAGGAGAATLTVNASGGAMYLKIQDAINNATGGDTILVYSGTYFENVNVIKRLILRGIGMPVVDAGGNGSAITLAADGIRLEGFNATGSGFNPDAGIKVTSNSNMLSGNNASNNWNGIYLDYSSNNNTLSGNNASSDNGDGISLGYSSNNMLSGNNASFNNNGGIVLSLSSNNILTNNTMNGNKYNFGLDGYSNSDFNNQIDKTNLVDGKTIYYIKNASDTIYDSSTNAGTFYCINCVNITLKNLDLKSNGNGIYFRNTTHSIIQNVKASNNGNGIVLLFSSNNTLNGNTASNNREEGISLSSSSNNTLNGNTASNNSEEGISLSSSSNCIFITTFSITITTFGYSTL